MGSSEQLIEAYTQMLRARLINDKSIVLYKQNKCHFQIGCSGHEAVQVAAAHVLKPGYDWAHPYYRGMAFCCAWGMTAREHFLGILNKADDPCSGGRQMPMHYGHKDLNILCQSSPTGTQFLQGLGCAMGVMKRGTDKVSFVSSGEGATSQGAYHEVLNWSARQKAPLILLIEDNNYAISVHISEQIAGESVAGISRGYEGLDVHEINGLDYLESLKTFEKAVARARKGDGPSVIIAKVVRLESHSISDDQLKYRDKEDVEKDKEKDPIKLFEAELIKKKVLTKKKIEELYKNLEKEVDEAASWAEEQADPEPHTAEDHVWVERDPGAEIIEKEAQGEELFMVDALNRALDEELERDKEVVIYGQDVAGGKGGVFTVTSGLTAKYGKERVFNSPLAEASIAGTAVGMSVLGFKPVVEIQFGDYVWTAMMQLRNELPMLNYRSNGAFTCPAVIRVPIGGYIHGALYHSQNIEATFSHFPGLFVVMPSNATDAKGLLKAAIRGKDPVLFLEHKGLYRQVYAKGKIGGKDDLIPLGRARIAREGTDATIVTYGALVNKSLNVAETLAKEGIEIEVIDIRTMVPLDIQTITQSIKKTNRALIAHEDVLFMGFGAEIAAQISEKAFEYLDAPIKRVAGKNTPIPHAPALEKEVLPQDQDIEKSLRELLSY